MPGRTRAAPRREIAAMMLIAAVLACGQPAAPATESRAAPTATTAPAATEPLDSAAPTLPAVGECEPPAAEIELGAPVSGEVAGHDQPPPERLYFCVLVPEGVSALTIEMTGMTAGLNLFAGYPDLETVQNGGFSFWAADQPGAEDKTIVIEPALTDDMLAGPYYIEVSAEDFRAGSPFTLLVRAP